MDPERLKQSISIATEAVANIEDKDLKLKSYEVILNNLISGQSTQKLITATFPSVESIDSYKLLSQKLGTNNEQNLPDYVELGDKPRILFKIERSNALEEQLIFLLTFLSVKKVCYGDSEINSGDLREILAEHKIHAINNLSMYVKKFNRLVVHKAGKIGSKKTSYRLTGEGLSNGLRLLSEIVEGKEASDLDLGFLGIKTIKRNKYGSKVGDEISKLVQQGFFDQHRKSSEVVAELRKRAFFNRRQDIDAYLRKILLGKSLLRERINDSWSYVIKK